MRFGDYLNTFSVEDLRVLAARRGIPLAPGAENGRQTLVRALSAVLDRGDNLHSIAYQLNQAEIAAFRYLLGAGKRASRAGLAAAARVEPATVQAVLESLRLWGLAFPEGDWEHIILPPNGHILGPYIDPFPERKPADLAAQLAPPALEPAPDTVACEGRPGSLDWDLAEFLARVARGRLKLTQARRMNRRDLKSMEPAFAIQAAGYSTFLSILAGSLGLLLSNDEGILFVTPEVDALIGQLPVLRARIRTTAWTVMRGYPETAPGDPADADYLPALLHIQRQRFLTILPPLDDVRAVSVASLARRLQWMAPASFRGWDINRDTVTSAVRLVRSLYWQGLLAVDQPELPRHARLTPLGAHALGDGASGLPELVPEEPRFFLQPNAEAFAPPNLAPRTLFHLRRLTGEKKGGAAGMYPLTAESVTRALDSGLRVPEILAFLQAFSRTSLPSGVRALVETAGRQHGRIRVVPAGYVLLTDDPMLMEELRSIQSVAPLLGDRLTERVAAVDGRSVPDLLRRLRARGYAPLNQAESTVSPDLPLIPDAPPPTLTATPQHPALPLGMETQGEWTTEMQDDEDPGVEAGPVETDPGTIRSLMEDAQRERLVVEIDYGEGSKSDGLLQIFPLAVRAGDVFAYCWTTDRERSFSWSRIRSAQLTGEQFTDE